MVESEQQRQEGRIGSERNTAFVHSHSQSPANHDRKNHNTQPPADSSKSPYLNGYKGNNYDPAKAARGRGALSRGGRNSNGGVDFKVGVNLIGGLNNNSTHLPITLVGFINNSTMVPHPIKINNGLLHLAHIHLNHISNIRPMFWPESVSRHSRPTKVQPRK